MNYYEYYVKPYIDAAVRYLTASLPDLDTLDEYVDFIVPRTWVYSEDLAERKHYVDRRWLEVRDDPAFRERVLHIFKADGKYLRSVDGDISEGTWEHNLETNGLVIKILNRYELYDKSFMNSRYFVLRKHGDERKHRRKYLVLGFEPAVKDRDWHQVVDDFFDVYRYNIQFMTVLLIIVVLVVVVLWFSYI